MTSSCNNTEKKCRIVVLISGSGSNLQALIDASRQSNTRFDINTVISNNADAYGLQRARAAGIPHITLDHRHYPNRDDYDQALIEKIDAHNPDLVVLAGFMRILSSPFVQHYQGKLLNIHPSLLPKYKGLHTHQRALEAGEHQHGTTVHFVTEELDGGPPVIQSKINIHQHDDADSLAKRVQQREHLIYPLAVEWFAEKRLMLQNQQASLDGQILQTPVQYETFITNTQPRDI